MIRLFLCATLLGFSATAAFGSQGDPEEGSEESKWDVQNPPGPWRTIPIETDETTWSNVDVSPDGKTVIFDMLGDIYAVPIDGGKATALTSGIAWNIQPRYSPDGKQIAFISDRNGADNLWVMDADGGDARAITEEREHLIHNPNWSPEGEWIVARKGFVSTRSIPSGEIWMFHAGGGQGLQVVERPHGEQSQKNIAEPAFSPDGRYIYYSQDVTEGQVWQYNKNALEQVFAIQRLNRAEGKTDLYAGGPGGAIRPTPSPDGRFLAFVKRLPSAKSALYVKEINSGNERPLYTELDRDLQETNGSQGNTPALGWTPDSRSVVFWAGGKIRRIDVDGANGRVIPVTVSDERKVRETLRFPVQVWDESFPVRAIRWAQYSPQGDQVVFHALGYLYIRDLNSGKQRRLTRQDQHFEFWPHWSPDGKSIVYTTWDDQALGTVRIASAGSGRSRVISTQPGHYVEPSFSPDGEQVVFRKFAGASLLSPKWANDPGLYVVGLDGGESKRVTNSGVGPAFSADGERLFFAVVEEDGTHLLKSVNLNGHDEHTHVKGAKITEYAVSPDGRWLAFTEQFNAYVTPFAITGHTVELGRESEALPVAKVSGRSGENLHWSADGGTLHWSHGATVYARELRDAFAFLEGSPDPLPEPVTEGLDLGFTARSDAPEGVIALTHGRIITMRDADRFEEVIQDGTVVVDGNRIVAVGQARDVTIPEGAFVLDLEGRTVIPGLIDVHAHGSVGNEEIIPEQNWMQFSNLAFGVTTIHDPSNDTTEIFSHAELQKAGRVIGPRTFSTGTILYGAIYPGYTAIIDSYSDALFHVRRLKDIGAISVKSYNQLRRDSRQQVIAAGAELGVMVVPEGGAKFQANMGHIMDGHTGIEHAIPLQTGYADVVQFWSATASGYTPTFGVAYGGLSGETYWYDRTNVWENEHLMRFVPRSRVVPQSIRRLKAPDFQYNHFQVARFAEALREAGVGVQIGAHGQREGLAAHWELWMMEQGGFTPWEALRGGTIDGARYLGFDAQIGSIEEGKLADLAVIDGNLLEDLRISEQVIYSMLNGRLFDTRTMNQIGNEPAERADFFFEQPGGDVFPVEVQEAEARKAALYGWRH